MERRVDGDDGMKGGVDALEEVAVDLRRSMVPGVDCDMMSRIS